MAFFNNTTDCDLSDDDPRLPVPFNEEDYGRATELDRKIMQLEKKEWPKECRLVGDSSLWQTLSGLQASTSNRTKVVVEPHDTTEFHTQGTVSKDTTIFLETPIPSGLDRITAIRLTGLPKNPEKAKADSEWGFVLSHVSAEILVPGSDTPQAVVLSRIIGDEPYPLIDPQLSLDARNPQGFGAYSRINHARRVAFVPAQPIAVAAGSRLRVALAHNVFELGAFPLVTHRGRVAVSDDAAFTEWLHDPAVLAVRREKEELNNQRKEIKSVAIPVMRDRLGRFSRPTHVFERGNFLTKGELVQSGTPAFLPPLQASGNADRLDLARWIANAKNPLTSRVIVNRIWAQLFGVGLVRTQEDFGSSGEKPSHPKLLDDLAVRFVSEMQWSIKQLVREIALSSTYRQSSQVSPELLSRDPDNRLLARGPRVRLPAETVRDQALAIAGLLNTKLFGPPVHPPLPEGVWMPFQGGDKWQTPARGDPDRYRRSIYTYTKRTIPYPLFASFDAPSREFCTARRLRSNTPLQALMTLNDEAFTEASQALGCRMLAAGKTREEQIAHGVMLSTCREPDPAELVELLQLYEDTRQALASSSHPVTSIDEAAMANVASVLLNLDEVLCK